MSAPPPLITQVDERRAIDSIRILHRHPHGAVWWTTRTPRERLSYVIACLLDLQSCCEHHIRISRRILHGFRAEPLTRERERIRRRACEILAAVALVDGTPGAVALTSDIRTN